MARRHQRRWTWAHRATAGAFLALLVLGRQEWFSWLKGTLGSTTLFGFLPMTDPLAALEVLLASRAFTLTLLAGTSVVLLIYAFLGRAFCGWICPLGLLCDLNDGLRRRMRRKHLKLPTFEVTPRAKDYLLAFFALVAFFAAFPVFSTISPINLVVWSCVFGFGPELFAVAVLLAVEHFSPRLFCRSLCPLGALYALIGRFGRLRVRVNPERAGQMPCRQCTTHCPMGIAVMEDYAMVGRDSVSDPECTRCGTCVDICPNEVLKLGFTQTSALDSLGPCATCEVRRTTRA